MLPIIVSDQASPRVRQMAGTLAEYLGRISDARFEVKTGDGRSGIAVGVGSDFSAWPFKDTFDAKDATKSEDYVLRSHAGGVYLAGATELAVEHAVWDFLYRLGYRQFFPGPKWEIVPHRTELGIAVDASEHPDYYQRRIAYGFGTWGDNNVAFNQWMARNRMGGGLTINSSHAYQAIIQAHKAEFAAHPEYLGVLNGQRTSKFCISNPRLRRLVVDWALDYLEKNPNAQSVPLEPSDGSDWGDCPEFPRQGSISDQVVTLANEVAEAVQQRFENKYVGIYAYNLHSPPPSVRVHPRVVVNIATTFIKGDYSMDELIAGWQRQGATIGIREYYSVMPWDRDLPQRARGSNLDYLRTTIPRFYQQGARFMNTEASDNWGPNGLGYYLTSRLLWDTQEAERADEIVADFLEKSFGPAQGEMAKFYALLDGSSRARLSDKVRPDLIGRVLNDQPGVHQLGLMYYRLDNALKLTTDPVIRARIYDLALYTRYVELYRSYWAARGAQRQPIAEELIQYSYRIHPTMMVHSLGLYRDLPLRDKYVTIPAEADWKVPEPKNPWKSSQPFAPEEIEGFIAAGVTSYKLVNFEPVAFSSNLVPAGKLNLPRVPLGSFAVTRGTQGFYTWIAEAPAQIALKVKTGSTHDNLGDTKIALYSLSGAIPRAVDNAAVPPDKQEHEVILRTTLPGLHRIEIADATAGTSMVWPDGLPMTVESSFDAWAQFTARGSLWSLYFYVPKGTRVVGGYAVGSGTMLDGDGRIVKTFDNSSGYFEVPVAPGQDGRLWKFDNTAGQRMLLTVPPYLARNAEELLLPAEVVETDM